MKKILLALGVLCLTTTAFTQVTVNIAPDKDNSIYAENNNSNGMGLLFSGQTCSDNSRRALIHFDVEGNVPAGATITAVSLSLEVTQISGSPSANDYTLYTMTSDWGEGTSAGSGTGATAVFPDATWNDAMLGTPWGTAGGDYAGAVATTNLPAALGVFNWSSAAMVTDVQNWLDDAATNYGWILLGTEGTTCSARAFGSKDQGPAPSLSITYSCTTPPTASCQSSTIYLDAFGQYTLTPSEIDGGSVANCSGPLVYGLSQTAFDCSDVAPAPAEALILTAVFDGNLTGGLPKGVELYVAADIPDLSIYGLGAANNGGGTDGQEFTFPAVSASAGTYIYVASEIPQFNAFFGFPPTYTDSDMGVNGDDAIELYKSGAVIDVFGELTYTVVGPWAYSDGFAYRNSNTGPDGSTFVIGNWTLSGVNALDPALTNGTAPIPVPVGTYTAPGAVSVTLTVTDQFANMATCDASVFVFDTLSPDAICVGPTTFDLDMSGNLTLSELDIDGGTTDNCSLLSLIISQTTFDCTNLGLNPITLTATDMYGNVSTCVADITIQQAGSISITLDNVTYVTCNGDADGSIDVSISGGSSPYTLDWDNDGTGDNDDTEDLSGLSGGTYTLVVTDQTGCTAQTIVSIIEPDVLDATLDVTDISCFGEEDGMIDMSVSGGSGSLIFDWDNDATGDFDDTEDLTNLAPGTYTVIIEDENGCSATFNETVSNATPVNISVTQTGFTLTSNATSATYQWINCPANTNVPGAASATFNPTADGDYAVIVTVNGCSDTSACYTISGLGLSDQMAIEFSLYPNPANNQITFNKTVFDGTYQVTFTDVNGRIVLQKMVSAQTEIIDISGLQNGTYFIRVSDTEIATTLQLIIAR